MNIHTVRSDGCLSYVLIDGGDAAIIDPARDVKKYMSLVAEHDVRARWVIDTHTHADHLSGARRLADELDAPLVMSSAHATQWKAAEGQADALGIGDILRANGGVKVDHTVTDGDTLELGSSTLRILAAPGHTSDSVVVMCDNRAFTGDTLMVGQIGRCDLPGGDAAEMHATLFERLGSLSDETLVYPGHDYDGVSLTVLGRERASNPFLVARTVAEFAEHLKTAFPTLTGAGMQCGATTTGASCEVDGVKRDPLRDEVAGFMDGYFFGAHHPENLIRVLDLKREIDSGKHLVLLDVREADEFVDARIDGAARLSVHELGARLGDVPAEPHDEIVTICRSGKRSGWAAMFLRVAGFKRVRSLTGGMLEWQKEHLPVATGEPS